MAKIHDDALESRDWATAEVDDRPRGVSIVQSVRFSRELNERLLEEAARRGVTPSHLVREFVEAGLDAAAGAEDATVTIRLADLHRAIDTAIRRAA